MSDRTQTFCDLSLYSCNNVISFVSPGTRPCGLVLLWAWMVHEIFVCLAYWWGTISNDYLIYQSKFFPQKFWNSVMICRYQVSCKQYYCLQMRHLCDQKKFSSKSDTCFCDRACKELFFDPLYLNHDNYVRYPTHTISICWQKGNRLVVVPFAANDVFRIIEITLTLGYFLIFFQVWHLLSIWPFCSYCVNSIIKKFINQCWAVKKLSKTRCNKSLSIFQTTESPHFPLN